MEKQPRLLYTLFPQSSLPPTPCPASSISFLSYIFQFQRTQCSQVCRIFISQFPDRMGRQTFDYSSLVRYLSLLSRVPGLSSQLLPLLLSLHNASSLLFPANTIVITPRPESIFFLCWLFFIFFALSFIPKITNILVPTLLLVTLYSLKRLEIKGEKQ